MTGKTHRAGGMLCCFIGYSILQQKGLLVKDVNPLLQATVMYPFALWGSTMSDLDHHAESAPSKDIISVCINRVLHLTTNARKVNPNIDKFGILDAKHRSWQTHSFEFLAIFIYLFYQCVFVLQQTNNVIILRMVTAGLTLGVISHIILDMLTPEGIWCILFVITNKVTNSKLPEKIHIVPKSKFFATDGPWEKLIRVVLWVANFIYLLYLIYLVSPYRITFDFMG